MTRKDWAVVAALGIIGFLFYGLGLLDGRESAHCTRVTIRRLGDNPPAHELPSMGKGER